jgi:S-adenosylmethionine decarboxylase
MLASVPVRACAGVEWLIDAYGCSAAALRSVDALDGLVARLIDDLGLHPLAPTTWHTFPGEGGVTGLLLLSESHLTCHTFPELGFVALNLYCCRQRTRWPWEAQLIERFDAERVVVRELVRG